MGCIIFFKVESMQDKIMLYAYHFPNDKMED